MVTKKTSKQKKEETVVETDSCQPAEPLKTEAEILEELEALEKQEEAEEQAMEEEDLDDGVAPMTEAEIAAMTGQAKKSMQEKTVQTKKPVKEKKSEIDTPVHNSLKPNVIGEKTLLYHYPNKEEWEQIHNIKPERIIFYFRMTKHEYKELFLCQVRYKTKIVPSTGARVI